MLTLTKHTLLSRLIAMGSAALVLSACSGDGNGAEVVTLPVTNPPPVADYNGPAPSTADVQSFKLNVWDNVSAQNRCGACHGTGGQTPTFARNDDINLAYADTNPLVNLTDPGGSLIVTKVGGGHNCWESSDAVCEDILTTWVSGWAGDAVAGGGNQIELEAPPIKDVGQSKGFPEDSGLFASTIHPLTTTYCSQCHASDAAFPVQPYFADSDVDLAYDAAKSKLNLDITEDSRMVVRLRDQFHNCWSDCSSDSAEMLAAINAMADQIPLTEVDPSLLTSKALGLFDGTIASGGNRYDNNVVALYEFKTGTGLTAFDTSGIEPALNLNFSGDVSWFGGYGIDIRGGKAQGSTAASAKLHEQLTATGEYTVEAWVVPANVTQEDARIISYSAGVDARNFSLQQTLYNYVQANRSDVTDGNGMPALSTADADEDLQATLQHVAVTFDPVRGRRIYVNGEFTGDEDMEGGGTLNDWDDTFAFVLGNEVSGNRPWEGVIRLVAIHNRALTDEQIAQNLEAGVGQKFFLLFSLEDLVDVPQSYLMFEVAQFDTYSYLFQKPTFISLDGSAQPDNIPVMGIRIGVNGEEAAVGQAYVNVDTMISSVEYTPNGQRLSNVGTIVPLEKGPENDEFFLTFEILGANTNVKVPASVPPPPEPADLDAAPVVGLRNFDDLTATMSKITGVSRYQSDVQLTFETIKQQLPTVETVDSFLASHQVAIAQLAIEYCNTLIEDSNARTAYFPGLDFNAASSTVFANQSGYDALIDPLVDGVVGANVASQPDTTFVRTELSSLVDRLNACGTSCAADRTQVIAKAVCAGALGSAATLLQ
ncbi:MAG: LamG domain-containing protein [Gammaproteobacteria bacterium]